jgi:integrase
VANIKLKYIKCYVDRHGRARHYLRKPGCKPVALPGLPGSDEFMAAYGEALAATPRIEVAATRTRAGSISAMIVGYLGSAAFHKLAPPSQQQYRRIFEGLRRDYGDLGIVTLARKHVVRILDSKSEHPGAARDLLRCLRLLVRYAIGVGVRQDDPTIGVRVAMPNSDGFRTWSEEDIAAFEATYPIGSKPRLALALLLGTAARCADVVRLGRGNIRGGTIHLTQQKTGTALTIPVTAELAEAINAAAPSEHMVFLTNELGRPFTARGFSKWFVKRCEQIGLERSAHGLRKAACRRLAEAGCSANEIAAISGHASLREVERYTRAADQAKLARNAVARTRNNLSRTGNDAVGT